jgi:AraC-like DNA-binding protein
MPSILAAASGAGLKESDACQTRAVDWSATYREYPPPAGLAAAVSCLWTGLTPAAGAPPTRVLPDGCVDLIWQSGRGVLIAGPDTGPVCLPMPPGTVLAGVRLRPGAAGAALGFPPGALLNQRLDAGELRAGRLAGPAKALGAELPGTLRPAEAIRRLAGIAAQMTASGPPDPLVAEAARRLGRPGSRVRQVAADLGISERQLHRRCCAAVGYGPVLLRRVLRFRRFVSWIDSGQPADLAVLATEAGYADQAHLTRDSAELAGLAPGALARARRPASPRASGPGASTPAG